MVLFRCRLRLSKKRPPRDRTDDVRDRLPLDMERSSRKKSTKGTIDTVFMLAEPTDTSDARRSRRELCARRSMPGGIDTPTDPVVGEVLLVGVMADDGEVSECP